mmetsp:Transcript_10077/g.17698  ORF Transcript_10077/g.17698 Transcript_10077/m.17698 type:complete len:188 (+) Transcript_10077:1319-1882(+)
MAAKNNVTSFASANNVSAFGQDQRNGYQKIMDAFSGNHEAKAAQEARTQVAMEAIGQAKKVALAKVQADGELSLAKTYSEFEQGMLESARTASDIATQGQMTTTETTMMHLFAVERARTAISGTIEGLDGMSAEQKKRLISDAEALSESARTGVKSRGKRLMENIENRFERSFGKFRGSDLDKMKDQ